MKEVLFDWTQAADKNKEYHIETQTPEEGVYDADGNASALVAIVFNDGKSYYITMIGCKRKKILDNNTGPHTLEQAHAMLKAQLAIRGYQRTSEFTRNFNS